MAKSHRRKGKGKKVMSIYANRIIIELEEMLIAEVDEAIFELVRNNDVDFRIMSYDYIIDMYGFDSDVYDLAHDVIFEAQSSDDEVVAEYACDIYGTDAENDVICDMITGIREQIKQLLEKAKYYIELDN